LSSLLLLLLPIPLSYVGVMMLQLRLCLPEQYMGQLLILAIRPAYKVTSNSMQQSPS